MRNSCLRSVAFLVALLFLTVAPVHAGIDHPYISEYGEGTGYNKYIELHNREPVLSVDLSGYRLWVAVNGVAWPGAEIVLSGMLPAGDVFVVCHPSADPRIKVHADLISGSLSHNGNDAVGLATSAGVLIDAVGQANDDPGDGWVVAGTEDATKDHVLQRKSGFTSGNTNWSLSASTNVATSEWIVHPLDTFDYVGYHGTAPEQPPFILLDPAETSRTVLVNSPVTLDVMAYDFNTNEVTLEAVDLPPGATFPSVTNTPPITNTFAWTPASGTNHTVTFIASDNDGSYTTAVHITVSAVLPPPEKIWINEIHYDNDGGDTGEGVEVAGRAKTDLSAYRLVFYNGSDQLAYDTDTLTGTLPDQQDGYGAAWHPKAGMQNGGADPDGVALIRVVGQQTNVLQFLSYEGSFAATDGPAKGFVATDLGVSEPDSTLVGESLQLIGTGSVYAAFTWTGPVPASPGSLNSNQLIKPPPTVMIVR